MKTRYTFLALLASTAFAGMAGSAFALDGNDVLAKINSVTVMGGMSLKADKVDTDGTTVTLTGTKVEYQGGPEGGLPVGTVTMDGVEEADGGYKVESIGFDDVNVAESESGVSIKDISISGVTIPSEVKPGTIDSLAFYESFHTGPVEITAKGKKVASIAEINSNVDVAEDKSGMTFGGEVSGINVDLTSVDDPKGKEAIEKLGLTQLNGEVTMKGDWTLADGKLNISEYAFDFENIGRIDLNVAISGYTLEFIKALQEATKAVAQNPDQAAGQQALGMAMMGLAQQLSFNSASIRYDDAGITPKMLDYAGSQQGVDGKQMAQSLKGMLPLMLGQLNMPELQTQISNAANAFLDDPKSLEVAAEPAQPVPFPQIMGAAMGAPQTLPQVLGVTITANE